MANRRIAGTEAAQRGMETHGGPPGGQFLATDFQPRDLRACEDHIRKAEKRDMLHRAPTTMAAVWIPARQQNKLRIAIYGLVVWGERGFQVSGVDTRGISLLHTPSRTPCLKYFISTS